MIKSVNGLGNGHDLRMLDVALWSEFGESSLVTRMGIDEGAVGNAGKGWVCGDVEGLCGNNSEREVSCAVSAGGNRCTRERN